MRDLSARLPGAVPAILAGALPLFYIPTLVDAYILPRVSLAIAGAGLLVSAAVVGRAFGAGWVSPLRQRLGPLGPAALAVILAALVAWAFAASVWLSLAGAYTRYESVVVRLAYLGLFCGTVWLLRNRRDRTRVVSWFLVGCAAASVEAVWQGATHGLERPDGNLGQAGLLGALTAMAVPVCAWRVVSDRRWLLALAPLLGGAWVSVSRSGWLGMVAGIAVLALLVSHGRRRWLVAGLGSAMVVAALALLLLSPLRSLNQDTGSSRLHIWQDSIAVIKDRPVTGWGEDGLGLVFGRHLTGNWEPGAYFDRAHSAPLDTLAARGLIGLGTEGWFWVTVAVGVWRGRRREEVAAVGAAVAAYAVWSLLNFDWAPATAPLWLLAAVAWSGAKAGVEPVADAQSDALAAGSGALEAGPASGSVRVLALAAAAAMAVVVAAFGVLPLAADSAYYRRELRMSVVLDPLQARYHRALGDELAANGDHRAALVEMRRAAELGEYDPSFYVALGDIEAKLGNAERARAAYRRAYELDRFDPGVLSRQGSPPR